MSSGESWFQARQHHQRLYGKYTEWSKGEAELNPFLDQIIALSMTVDMFLIKWKVSL